VKPLVEEIVRELQRFNCKSAVLELKKWFSGHGTPLNSQDLKIIMKVWVERFYPDSSNVNVDAEEDVWALLHRMAHEKNITLNQLVVLALEEQIEKKEKELEDE